jgi:two-component system CheB/CheR fusion protein
LQTILLLQGLLTEKVKDSEAQTLLKRLDATVGSMSGMLNTLLDINQLEAGTIEVEIESFPLDEMFERLNADFGYHMRAQGLDWRVVLSKSVVRSDPRLLEQILRNLLSNAVKFTPGGKVLLGCRRHDETMQIEIWDTGPGIAEEHRFAIFEEFHQINNPARERSKGLGLGLAIVQRVSDLLKRPVNVRSRPGRGSMFSVTVPLETGASTAAKLARRSLTAVEPKGSASILVIEDDPTIRELLELLLSGAGYRPIGVADGVVAISSSQCPELIIADFNLPNGPDGVETILQLQLKFERQIPAIVLTGDISTKTLGAIASHDCTHLDKPVDAGELLRVVAQVLVAQAKMVSPDKATGYLNGISSATLFVVDDDGDIRDAIRQILEANGWSVETYASCEAFLAARHSGGQECLVIDARLPGMDGF